MSITKYMALFLLLWNPHFFAGLSSDTLIKTEQSYKQIGQADPGDTVACMNRDGVPTFNTITHKRAHRVQNYVTITIDEDVIIATQDQKFFVPLEGIFKEAHLLRSGDMLLSYSGRYIPIRDTVIVAKEKEFYDISVGRCHNFFVSRSEVLVHNVAPIVIGLSWLFGEGAVQFLGASVGTALLGTAVGIKMHRDKNKNTNSFSFCNVHEEHGNYWYASDAQAPGKPTDKDGYVPPKNWDGKKKKHPKTGQYGYPDKKGNVWIPTGQGSGAHGGPHWDVVSGDGKKHDNIVPGGRIRGEK